MSARLAGIFPRVIRGFRRHQERSAPVSSAALGPRHIAALQELLAGPVGVGDLAFRLGLTLPTVSGVIADLDRAGFVERRTDPLDRRRTIVEIAPGGRCSVESWLEGSVAPLARVLDALEPHERVAFLKAMDLLEREFAGDAEAPIS